MITRIQTPPQSRDLTLKPEARLFSKEQSQQVRKTLQVKIFPYALCYAAINLNEIFHEPTG